jgi:putative transposase
VPRKPRFYLPGVPVHIVQRGHSREAVFFEDGFSLFELARRSRRRHAAPIHAYVLMTNLYISPPQTDDGITCDAIHRAALCAPSSTYGTSGSIWEELQGSLKMTTTYFRMLARS